MTNNAVSHQVAVSRLVVVDDTVLVLLGDGGFTIWDLAGSTSLPVEVTCAAGLHVSVLESALP
jgi:hypothetical protein